MRLLEGGDGRLDVGLTVLLLEEIRAAGHRGGTRIDPVKSSGAKPGLRAERPRRGRRRQAAARAAARIGHHRDRHRGGDRDLGRGPREQRLDLPQELLGVERLRDDGVAAEPLRAVAVERLEGAREEDDRDRAPSPGSP